MPRAAGRPEAEPLWATERNPVRETKGGRVATVSARLGKPFMPHQRLIADVAREVDPATGHPWYREIIVEIVRQAGKTTYVLADQVDKSIYKPGALIRYTAQTRTMALERLERDFWGPVHRSPLRSFLDTRVGRRTGKPGLSGKNGSERLAFANSSAIVIDSVRAVSGHGPALDGGAIDEAFAHSDWLVEQSMAPAMVTVPDAQLVVASAAGDANSRYLREKTAAARARLELEQAKPLSARTSRTAFFQYAVGPDEDPDDPEVWWHRHPALGWTITEATLAAERERFEANPDEFYRAYCGIWTSAKVPDPVIPAAAWRAQALDADEVDWAGDPVWGVDVSPDRQWASTGLAADRVGGGAYVEVVDHEPGTSWVVPRMVQLRSHLGGDQVVLDGSGPAASLDLDLEAEGFRVRRLNVREKAEACADVYDGVLSGWVWHPGDATLNTAQASAVKRHTGDTWTFWRGRSLADISPLYAVVLPLRVWHEERAGTYDPAGSTM